MECYLLRLHFSVLNFYFVSAKDDRDILANTGQISVETNLWISMIKYAEVESEKNQRIDILLLHTPS